VPAEGYEHHSFAPFTPEKYGGVFNVNIKGTTL